MDCLEPGQSKFLLMSVRVSPVCNEKKDGPRWGWDCFLGKTKAVTGAARCTTVRDPWVRLLLPTERPIEGEQGGTSLQYTKKPCMEGLREWGFSSSKVYGKYSSLPEMLLLCSETLIIHLAAADGPFSGELSPFAGRSTQE